MVSDLWPRAGEKKQYPQERRDPGGTSWWGQIAAGIEGHHPVNRLGLGNRDLGSFWRRCVLRELLFN